VWDFTSSLSVYIWFICYSLLDRSSPSRDPFSLQLGSYRPFWGGTNTPYAKGAAYLRRIEAHNPEQLAVAQLKGIKLLAWSVILDLFLRKAFMPVVHGQLGIPVFSLLLGFSARGGSFPWYVGWASLIANFFEELARLSILGHRIIASCRMAGFL